MTPSIFSTRFFRMLCICKLVNKTYKLIAVGTSQQYLYTRQGTMIAMYKMPILFRRF
uniref:Uncharacterized protein n=1 Tax=Hyaloperonospora arabidopsidis (strain Emoy2) TaxID=559515 RepID=M4BTP3_HYAAE